MILLDTNVVSALMVLAPEAQVVRWFDDQLPSSLWLNAVSMMELRFGLLTMPAGKRRDASTAALERFLERLEHRIATFDAASAESAAELDAQRRRTGRPGDMRDTMIAGIALANHASAIATRNVRHFSDLSLEIVNPWA